MKRTIITAAMALIFAGSMHSIELNFAYFIPFNGGFASPIAPVGFDDLGFTFGDYFGISTGLVLYNVGGMAIKGIEGLQVNGASTGPFASLNIPLYLKIILPLDFIKFELKGGGFVFYNFGVALNKSFDAGLAKLLGYDTLVSSFQFDNNIGIGWRAGAEITVFITKNIGIVAGANFLSGFSVMNIRGQYTATTGTTVVPGTVNYPNAFLDYTGIVVSIGVDYLFN